MGDGNGTGHAAAALGPPHAAHATPSPARLLLRRRRYYLSLLAHVPPTALARAAAAFAWSREQARLVLLRWGLGCVGQSTNLGGVGHSWWGGHCVPPRCWAKWRRTPHLPAPPMRGAPMMRPYGGAVSQRARERGIRGSQPSGTHLSARAHTHMHMGTHARTHTDTHTHVRTCTLAHTRTTSHTGR